MKVAEMLRFPNDDGFLVNHVWGKTLRDGDENVFGIRRNLQLAICPIKGIEQYMAVARDLRIDLTTGYLLRPTNPQGGIVDSPFSSATAEARLKSYLKEMRADEGQTLHGLRGVRYYIGVNWCRFIRDYGSCRMDLSTYCTSLSPVSQGPEPLWCLRKAGSN